MSPGPPVRPVHNTLRLSPAEHAAILAELDAAAGASVGLDQRSRRRLRYRGRPVTIVVREPGGSVDSFAVKPHKLGPGGLSFLYGTFVHTQAVCDVTLHTADQHDVTVLGRVVRCRLIRGRVHEVGVAFFRPIDVGRFVPDAASHDPIPLLHADPPCYTGRVLCFDTAAGPNEAVELLHAMAGEFGVSLWITHDRHEAGEMAARGEFDLVMVRISASRAGDVGALRAASYAGPVVGFTDQTHSRTEARDELAAWTEGCDCIVSLPLTFDRLADLFDDYLTRDWGTSSDRPPMLSAHWSKVRMRPLILRFLARLEDDLLQLQALWQAQRTGEFDQACLRLIADAETYGYELLAGVAHDLRAAAGRPDSASSVAAMLPELFALAGAAQRARDEFGVLDAPPEGDHPALTRETPR